MERSGQSFRSGRSFWALERRCVFLRSAVGLDGARFHQSVSLNFNDNAYYRMSVMFGGWVVLTLRQIAVGWCLFIAWRFFKGYWDSIDILRLLFLMVLWRPPVKLIIYEYVIDFLQLRWNHNKNLFIPVASRKLTFCLLNHLNVVPVPQKIVAEWVCN